MDTILAYDLGTSGVKCALFSLEGRVQASRTEAYSTAFPHPGWHEQRPKDWLDAIIRGTRLLLDAAPDAQVQAIGISGHSLGAIPIDREGTLLAQSAPIWSDTRAQAQADRFFRTVEYRQWYDTTGNGFPRNLYALFKILWYQDHAPQVYRSAWKFLGTKDYVNFFLTGEAATDPSYASGSGLYDLAAGCYRADYGQAAGIDLEKLPRILPSGAALGRLRPQAAEILGLRPGIPVAAGGVDNACMTLGAGCCSHGDVYASLGSSAWIIASADRPVTDYDSRIYTFAHCVPGQFLPGIGIFASGSALAWAAKHFFADLTGDDRFDRMGALAAQSPAGARGLMFNPCLAGGSSFDKSPNIRGCLFPLELRHDRADIARAVFEGIAMHLRLASIPLERAGLLGQRLLLVGGGAKGAFARQTYANVFGRRTEVTQIRQDAAALGAAALAAVACGAWKDVSRVRSAQGSSISTEPQPENVAFYQGHLSRYQKMCDMCSETGDLLLRQE